MLLYDCLERSMSHQLRQRLFNVWYRLEQSVMTQLMSGTDVLGA